MSTVTVTMCHDELSKKHSDNGLSPAVTAASSWEQTPAPPSGKTGSKCSSGEEAPLCDMIRPHLLPREASRRTYVARDHSGEKECMWAWLGWIGGVQQRRWRLLFISRCHRCRRPTGGFVPKRAPRPSLARPTTNNQALGNLYDWVTKGGAKPLMTQTWFWLSHHISFIHTS